MPPKKAPCFLEEFGRQVEYIRCTAASARQSSAEREKLFKSVVRNFLGGIEGLSLTFQEASELTQLIQAAEFPEDVRNL